MREVFDHLWDTWSLSDEWQQFAVWTLALVSLVLLSYVVGWMIRGFVGSFIRRLAKRTQNKWDDYLFDKKFFHQLGMLAPALVSYFLFNLLMTSDKSVYPVVQKILLLLICITTTSFVNQFISNVEKGFLGILGEKKIPIRSYGQVAKLLLFLVAGILIVSVLLDQNPLGILTGLGALTAVLLLVFKDSLLGFVASLQLNTNNMVQIGDWIEIPGQNIDGEVIDIALSIVKIRSGDNTVYSLPTYSLVSAAFKNWRNVKDVGARRLKLSFPVDALSLSLVTPAQVKKLGAGSFWKVPEGREFVTNLEAFRFWAQDYLEQHADVHPDLVRLVKIGDPAGRGVPVEMVFYTRLTGFPDFEHLHSHLVCVYLAALATFGLSVFQEPVGVMRG